MSERLAELYPNHVATVVGRAERALAFGGFDHLLIASGREQYRFLDDRPLPFVSHPPFKAFVPLTQQTDSWIVVTPGRKPVLVVGRGSRRACSGRAQGQPRPAGARVR